MVAVGSVAELELLSGVKVVDLHRESVDGIEIPSARPGFPPLKRIPEVCEKRVNRVIFIFYRPSRPLVYEM